jgi:hypothetical protein
MNLLDLPLELFQRILHEAILARGWENGLTERFQEYGETARAMRLRLVNRTSSSVLTFRSLLTLYRILLGAGTLCAIST